MDKNNSLNEVIEAIYLEQKEIESDEIKVVTSSNLHLLSPKQTQKKVDYSKLFSYLGGGVKKNPYLVYKTEKLTEKSPNKKEPKKIIDYGEIVDVVKTSKMDRILGRLPKFINPNLKERFDNFKIFNEQYVMLLYQIVNI